jgi:hypothetical protein
MRGVPQGVDPGDGLRPSFAENTAGTVEHTKACLAAMEAVLCVEA